MEKALSRRFYYGGQAVIEGVMMRGRKSMSIAVRRPDGEIETVTESLPALSSGRLRRIPLVRGIVVLSEALVLGMRAILYSTNASLEEEEKISPALLGGTLGAALALAVALFFILPLLLASFLDHYLGSSLVSNLIEGLLRLGIFIAYLKSMSLLPDIRRVFAYHGAEHKVINAYEDGAPLEVETVRGYSTAHVRCGTGFILVILIIAILLFVVLGHPPIWLRLLSRIIFIPIIIALGYEVILFGASHSKNAIVRALLAPGLALQTMTTREPDDDQLEVALSALKGVLEDDEVP